MLPDAVFAAMRCFTKKVVGVVSNASGAIDRPSININTKLHAMVGCLLCRELLHMLTLSLCLLNCCMHVVVVAFSTSVS